MHLSLSSLRKFLPYVAATIVGLVAISVSWVHLPPKTIELVIISGVDPTGIRRKLVNDWNVAHPQTNVVLREYGGDTGKQRLDIRDALRRGVADVAILDSVHVSEFAAPADGTEGIIAELKAGETLDDGFLPGPLATCRWEGKLYGLPLNTDVGLVFSAGDEPQPETWNDMKIEADSHKNRQQIALQLGDNEAFVVNVLEEMLAVDPTLLDAGKPVRRNQWEAAIKPLRDAYKAGYIYDSTTESRSTVAFNEGRVRFMRNWPAHYTQVTRPLKVRKLFGPGVLGGQDLVVSKQTADYAESLKLMKFLTSESSQAELFRLGGFAPTRTTTYGRSEVRQDVPYAAQLLDAVRGARPRPITPKYVQVSKLILSNLRPAIKDGVRLNDSFALDMQEALHK